ncbi:CLUMA_CG000908, isoform A [Clunio marinus]|uniref:CLUMA_CG000908, isoform A n=1 Tax=Clunio marinus TaxID=568069 RepID=A0A1J1HLJ3_9DIPT|nr:CLUMA_CG000908, isoform A [Clunio marinus]
MNYFCSLATNHKLFYLGTKFCKVTPEGAGDKLLVNLFPAPSGVTLQKYNLWKEDAECIKEQLFQTYIIPNSNS